MTREEQLTLIIEMLMTDSQDNIRIEDGLGRFVIRHKLEVLAAILFELVQLIKEIS